MISISEIQKESLPTSGKNLMYRKLKEWPQSIKENGLIKSIIVRQFCNCCETFAGENDIGLLAGLTYSSFLKL